MKQPSLVSHLASCFGLVFRLWFYHRISLGIGALVMSTS